MPLNCPVDLLHYNACTNCRNRDGIDCIASYAVPIKLSSILTIGERLAILEDRDIKTQPEWTGKQWDYVQQLKAQVLFLTNKVNELLARKKKDKGYKDYAV